jgi:hypothetical protein
MAGVAMPGQVESRARREAVLERADEVGVEAAAAEAGVTVRTVERWRSRARAAESGEVERLDGELVVPNASVVSSAPVSQEDDGDLGAQLSRTAQAARRAAEKAIARLEEALPTARNPQALAVAVGVMTDKAAQLQRILDEEEERKARLAQGQAEVIAGLFPLALQAAGVPVDAFRPVLGELLRRAGEGGPLVVSPAVAQPAYAAVRGYFERIFREELEEDRWALPAGPDAVEEAEAQELCDALSAGGEVTVGAVPDAEEVADAEVVDERSLDEQARELSARIMENMAEEERAEPWSALRTRTAPSTFSVDDPADSIVRGGPERWA